MSVLPKLDIERLFDFPQSNLQFAVQSIWIPTRTTHGSMSAKDVIQATYGSISTLGQLKPGYERLDQPTKLLFFESKSHSLLSVYHLKICDWLH